MKTIFLFLLSTLSLSLFAQTEQSLLAQAAKYEAALNEEAAIETYKQALKINPNSYQALWKISELHSRIGNRKATDKEKKDFFIAGKNYALAAIKINPNSADGYYALSVAMGRLALVLGGKEKINSVKEIRSNAEKALKYNPQHGRAWHVLGKWHYEVSNLNMFEKAGLKLVYGGLPPASFQQSINAYEKAKQLEPNFALNYLELAKAYQKNNQNDKAIEQLKKLFTLPNKTADDAHIKASGAKLLKELNS